MIFVSTSTPICCACFKKMSQEERKYYETRCERCERNYLHRVATWKAGRYDEELDMAFGRPA